MLLRTGHRGRLLVTPTRGSRGALDQLGVNVMRHMLNLRVAVDRLWSRSVRGWRHLCERPSRSSSKLQTRSKRLGRDWRAPRSRTRRLPKNSLECMKQWQPKHADDERGVGGQLPKHAESFPGKALTTAKLSRSAASSPFTPKIKASSCDLLRSDLAGCRWGADGSTSHRPDLASATLADRS